MYAWLRALNPIRTPEECFRMMAWNWYHTSDQSVLKLFSELAAKGRSSNV